MFHKQATICFHQGVHHSYGCITCGFYEVMNIELAYAMGILVKIIVLTFK